MKRKKHISIRTCIITRKKYNKYKLLRFVKTVKGLNESIELDLNFKKDGRGAYLMNNIEIIKKAIYNSKLERALRLKGGLSKEGKDLLLRQVKNLKGVDNKK